METRLGSELAASVATGRDPSIGSSRPAAQEELKFNIFESKPELDSEVDLEDLHKLVDDIETVARSFRRNLSFSVDEELGRTVVKVMDAETEELIREIPPDYMLELARNIERIRGILFDESA